MKLKKMVYRRCEICNLRSGRKDGEKRDFMARFPLDEARCKLWVKATGKEDLAYIPVKKLNELKFVCGKHFKDKDFKKKKTQLKQTAVPSLRLIRPPLSDDVLIEFPFRMFSETIKKDTLPSLSPPTASLDEPQLSEYVILGNEDKQSSTNNYLEDAIQEEVKISEPYSSKTVSLDALTTSSPPASLAKLQLSEYVIFANQDPPSSETNIFDNREEVELETDYPSPSHEVEIDNIDIDNVLYPITSIPSKPVTNSLKSRTKSKLKIKKINECKITLKSLKQKAKVFNSIMSKALKTMLLTAYKNQNRLVQCWSNNEKALALAMFKKSPKMYIYLRKCMPLPTERLLENVFHKIPFDSGINNIILKQLLKKTCFLSSKDKMCVLVFDVISVKRRLVYNVSNDHVDGYQDLGEHGRGKDLADKALVLLIQGIHKKFKQPLAYYFFNGRSSLDKLMVIIKNAINVISKTGLNVIATVCDQSPTNVIALNLLKNISGLPEDRNYFLIEDTKKVHIIFDVPHLLLAIRNNFLEAGELVFDGQTAKWRHLTELHQINTEILHFNKFTARNVNPKRRAKKIVKLAAQTLSNDVSAILKLISWSYVNKQESDHILKRDSILETANVVEQLNKLFDITNGPASKKDIIRGKRTHVTQNSIHHSLWPEFENKIRSMHLLKNDSKLRLRNMRCINAYHTTLKSFQDIWNYVQSVGFECLNLRQLNKDSLDNLFSLIRQHSPTNQNLTCHNFTVALKSTILTKMSSPLRGANCELDNSNLLMDYHGLVFKNSDADNIVKTEHNYDSASSLTGTKIIDPQIYLEDDDEITNDVILFNEIEKHPVQYIGGYLASILIKLTDCHICWDSLRVETPGKEQISNLIELQNTWQRNMSIEYPTTGLCETVETCVGVFERDVTPNFHVDDIGKYCCQLMLKEVNISWVCEKHNKELMELLLLELTTFLIRNECKKRNLLISQIK